MDGLIVMCPQNSFLDPKGTVYMGEKAEILKIRLIDYMSDYCGKKYFFLEKRAQADNFFVNDKTHLIVNTFDYKIVESLKKFADVKVEKIRYSGLFETGFENRLKRDKIKRVTVVGLETHTSVLFTVEELRNYGIHVEIIEPLLASRDEYMHNVTISLMTNYLGVRFGT